MLTLMRVLVPALILVSVVALAQQAAPPGPLRERSEAMRLVGRMRALEARVTTLAAQARRRQDIVLLNCVNDKLGQLRGNLSVAEQSVDALGRPEVEADAEAKSHELAKISLTHQKVVVLAQEAETCSGEALRYAGSTQVETAIDPNVPEEDPTDPPIERLEMERPPMGSPF
jgi:hypothetical protein